ncbi:MAG: cardiolipin synthase [Clostridiales bacterium]|nr:cardiolipin synthase [Clostridiales bacterium]
MENNTGNLDEKILLLEKGKRGILGIIFGRTTLIVAMLLLQIVMIVAAFNRFTPYVPYFYGVLLLFYGAIILHLVNRRMNPEIKISWILLMVVIPVVGVVLYLFVENDLGCRLMKRRLSQLIRETKKYVPEPPQLKTSLDNDPNLNALAKYSWEFGHFPIYENTEAKYLPTGEETMEEMIRQLEKAEKFIFMEFFIIDEGYMWGRILKILEEKVKQGVEVRVMYDGTCALFRLPYHYPEKLKKLGIKCKMFAPIRPFVSTHYNNRDHRKILVIDGNVAFTGGVNLADEYINRRKLYGHWKDVAVMLRGEAVRSFTLMFLQMWDIEERTEDFSPFLECTALPENAPGYVLPYGDSPLDHERVGEMVYLDIINRARRYVHIMTPYLILDSEMVTALTFAAKRGVDVAIILPHIPDKKYAFALAKTHYRELIEGGVRIMEYIPGFIHAKTFVSDDTCAVVGSINLDYRSLYLHFECAAYLSNMPAVMDVERDFIETAASCQTIGIDDLKKEKFLIRAAGWLLKVFAPMM